MAFSRNGGHTIRNPMGSMYSSERLSLVDRPIDRHNNSYLESDGDRAFVYQTDKSHHVPRQDSKVRNRHDSDLQY